MARFFFSCILHFSMHIPKWYHLLRVPAFLVKTFDHLLFHVLLGQNENANEYAQNVVRPTFCSIFVFPTWHLWSHWTAVPWVPEVFSRGRRDLSALAEGWHIFGRRPKPRTGQKPRLEKSLAPRRSRVRIPYKPEFFLAFFRNCEKLCQNAMIFFHIIQLTLLKVPRAPGSDV